MQNVEEIKARLASEAHQKAEELAGEQFRKIALFAQIHGQTDNIVCASGRILKIKGYVRAHT